MKRNLSIDFCEILNGSTRNRNLKQHHEHKQLYTSSEEHPTGFLLKLVKNCMWLLQSIG